MHTVETHDVHGLTVRIVYDEDPENPRDWDNLGTMVCWHRRYLLGDRHGYDEPHDFERFIDGTPHIRLPLYLYDHSGITMNTTGFSCPWDSGQVGWCYVPLDKVRKEYGVKRVTEKIRRKAIEALRAEVATYDEFLTGSVYGYIVKDEDGAELDSCWGFFGLDFCREDALAAARSCEPRSVVEAKANSLDGSGI